MDLAQTVEDFHRDGFVRVPGLLSEGELRALQHDTQHIIDGGYEDVANSTDYRTAPDPDTGKDVFNRVQFVFPLATTEPHPQVLALAHALLGDDALCIRRATAPRCRSLLALLGHPQVLAHSDARRRRPGSRHSPGPRLPSQPERAPAPHPLLRVPVPGLDAARRGPAGCGNAHRRHLAKARIRLTRHAIETRKACPYAADETPFDYRVPAGFDGEPHSAKNPVLLRTRLTRSPNW